MRNVDDMTVVDFEAPMAIHLVRHPSDIPNIEEVENSISESFSRDIRRPFSRSVNIPIFLYSSDDDSSPPADYPEDVAEKNIIFVFTSVNTLGNEKWSDYIENIPVNERIRIVPVSLDKDGLAHSGSMQGLNALRAYEWPKSNVSEYALIFLGHEIYRYCLNPKRGELGRDSSLKLFLSHAKSGGVGVDIAEAIKRFVDGSNISRFFDANDISPGYRFDEEIESHIKSSSVIAIQTDEYSSRYWCQKEILYAKKESRPIVVVDALHSYEDRIFPAASNVPCVHLESNFPISDAEVLKVLGAIIVETVRCNYVFKVLKSFKECGWIPSNCELLIRPPEIRALIDYKNSGVNDVCYPEPPLYSEESDWCKELGMRVFTPLWRGEEISSLGRLRIGLSLSSPEEEKQKKALMVLSQDFSRNLLARSATLVYGGDLRKDGFTQFVLDEAAVLKDRIRATVPHVENHLSWPLYLSGKEVVAWRARYKSVMKTVEHELPSDLKSTVDDKTFLAPSKPRDRYVWARCLTEMRKVITTSCDARICAGGKATGYLGSMPGVLEEIAMALDGGKPLYLLGGFDGVTGYVCDLLNGRSVAQLTERWQADQNPEYAEVAKIGKINSKAVDFEKMIKAIRDVSISDLAGRSGLAEFEYRRLMKSPFVEECVHLVVKGLKHTGGKTDAGK